MRFYDISSILSVAPARFDPATSRVRARVEFDTPRGAERAPDPVMSSTAHHLSHTGSERARARALIHLMEEPTEPAEECATDKQLEWELGFAGDFASANAYLQTDEGRVAVGTYLGSIMDGLPHGHGRLTLRNGQRWSGWGRLLPGR